MIKIDSEYMSTTVLAEYVPHLTPGAVRNLVMRRKIPFRKPAGRLVFIKSEIDEWIQNAPGVKPDDLKER